MPVARHLLRAASLIAAALPAAAQEPADVPLDTKRTQAEFDVRVMWMFDVHGRFGTVNGSVRLDRAAQSVQVVARIDARGVDMRRDSYEEWVRSPEFFDVERHPEIRFESEPFPLATLDLGGDIVGSLTVRGTTRPTRWRLRASDCPGRAALDCPVLADGVIERSEFGMTTRRATLSDKVRLHLTIWAAPGGGSS
jgi:polyisoprenoid-binding protein YceI